MDVWTSRTVQGERVQQRNPSALSEYVRPGISSVVESGVVPLEDDNMSSTKPAPTEFEPLLLRLPLDPPCVGRSLQSLRNIQSSHVISAVIANDSIFKSPVGGFAIGPQNFLALLFMFLSKSWRLLDVAFYVRRLSRCMLCSS